MKRIKSLNILMIVVILISIFSFITPVSALSATVGFSGNSSVTVGSTITVKMYISNVLDTNDGVVSAGGNLSFDSSYLEYVSGTGATTPYQFQINESANYKIAGLDITGGNGITSQTTVFTFVFKAKKVGSTTVTIKNATVSDTKIQVTPTISSKTITITDKVDNPPVDEPKNSDATLKSLAADGYSLSPSFSSGTTSYTIKVPSDATQVKLTGAANNSKATVTGLGTVTLTGNTTTATVKVTAEDGTVKNYTVKIVKDSEEEKPSDGDKLSSDATLKSLDVSGYTLSPSFKSSINTYSMKVKNNVTSLKVDAIPNSDKAKVEISGNTNWQEGNNVITIKVTAEDGSTNTYIVNVNRASSGDTTTTTTKSSDNYLKSLTINSSHTISPKFDKNTSAYNIEVPYEINKLDLSAIANDSKAKVEITGNENFEVGKVNIVEIKVTAEDGSIRIYTLNVTRSSVSSGTDLEDIIVTGATLSPQFNPNVTKYTTTVDGDISELDIKAIAKDKDATVEIIGNDNLKEGKNTILIKVTDKNGYSKYYTIEVEKEADASSGTILGLTKKQFWTIVGILGALLILLLIPLILLLRKKKDQEEIYREEKEYKTPVIEIKPEFNFGSKNTSDDDVVHGNLNQDSELEYEGMKKEEEEPPYDMYDETVTKAELIDAIREAKETKDPTKLKMLLDQEEFNQRKKEIKKRDLERKEKDEWR